MHPMGGTAYLNVENAEEPFLGGVKFTAMPPTKRFRDMEQLSGGEKARLQLAPHEGLRARARVRASGSGMHGDL